MTLASDREREATVLRLRAAHLEGRLDVDELERRMGIAHAAQTRADLVALEADLPAHVPSDLPLTDGRPRWPGRRHFTERKLLALPVAAVRDRVLHEIVPALERLGYYPRDDEPDRLTFTHRERARDQVSIRLQDAGDRRTLVVAHGFAPLTVRKAFARL